MTLEAGTLRHRVKFQRPVYTQNTTTGAMEASWTDVADVWAAIEPLSGREFISAQSEQSKIVARFVIRSRSDLSADMRILHNGKIYNVEGLLTDKDSGLEYITIPVSEGVREY